MEKINETKLITSFNINELITISEETALTFCLWGSVFVLSGNEIIQKKAAETASPAYIIIALFLSCVGSLLYLPVIKNDLASGYLITTSLMTLGVLGASVFLFGETLNAQKIIAALLLLSASVIQAIPTPHSPT